MKKIFITLVAIFFFATATQAQFELGAKVGGTFGKLDGESFKQGYNFGINAGAFLLFDINDKVGIQPEILFNQVNTTVKDNVDFDDVLNQGKKGHLNYLSIPVLLSYKPIKLLSLQVGPQFGILMNKHNSLVQNGQEAFKSGDFGLDLGAQLNLGKLKVYGRYNIGLANISDVTNSDKWTNQQIQVGIGIVIL